MDVPYHHHIRTSAATGKQRLYYLDWLRVLAVLGVFYAHTINVFDLMYWQHSSQRPSFGIMLFVQTGSEWGMALFFLLSGASSWFALGSRTGRQFIHERFSRLVIPFLVGFVLLCPPQAYFLAVSHALYRGSYFGFYPYFFETMHIGWDPLWLRNYGYHLWFLAFLFIYSLVALPLFTMLRQERGQRFIGWLARISEHSGGLFWFIVPVAVVLGLLRVRFPEYENWADFFVWLLFFFYGYLLYADHRFAQVIEQQGKVALILGIASILALVLTYYSGYLVIWETHPDYTPGYLFYQLLRSITFWSWLIFILYFGMRVLDANSRVLHYLSEAALPFYLLHQLIIVMSAYIFAGWATSTAVKLAVVSTLSLIVTLSLYDLIRRNSVMLWLFGIKPHA